MSDRTGITEITAPIAAGNAKTPLAVHFSNEAQGGLKFFSTASEMTTFAQDFAIRCFQSVAYVIKGENNYPSFYAWTGKNPDGTDGQFEFLSYAGGVVLADTGGGLPSIVSTIVFGDDFAIQVAGDQGGGSMVQLSDAIKNALNQKAQGNGLISVGTYTQPATFSKGNILEFEWPLKAWPDADTSNAFRVSMDHSAFEPLHKPSFLAYLQYSESLVGKIQKGKKGHRDGALWFDDVRWPDDTYIQKNMAEKSYGIQEADTLDPNVTGGTDYLIVFVVNSIGKAPDDGFVRAYLYNKAFNDYSPTGYLKDINNQPMIVERHYKKGEEMKALVVAGVVNAKGLTEFTYHVVDDFTSDNLMVSDPYYGVTGTLIQAITSESSTGVGRVQFAQDSGFAIRDSKFYLGPARLTIDWLITENMPIEIGEPGQGLTLADGFHFYNLSRMGFGVVDNHLVFQSDGVNICDFNFGKIFNSEETIASRGKQITFTATIIDKDDGFNVALMKWTGSPDGYTKEIYTSRNNGSPIFQPGWFKVDELFISEDVVSGDHTVTKDFTIPADANNYALIIYPISAQIPMNLKLKKFQGDMKDPSMAYALRGLENLKEKHLEYSKQYKEFAQDSQGYASLRYTINTNWLPMPVGEPKRGAADITLDPSINKVTGSSARGGEGAIKFDSDGVVSGTIDVLAWNEQATEDSATFRLVLVDPVTGAIDGDNNQVIAEMTFPVPAKSVGTQKEFEIKDRMVEAGERWALLAKSSKMDGAFLQCVNDLKPMVKIKLSFNELVQANP